jgi:hypothetical protein
MQLNWREIDRFLAGEAWTGSRIGERVQALCEEIGPRWASSQAERRAAEYICGQFAEDGLEAAQLETFTLQTWDYEKAEAVLVGEELKIDLLLFNRCPPCRLEAPLINTGYGTAREIDTLREKLPGAIALMHLAYEPFTTPVPHAWRLVALAEAGAAAVLCIDPKDGRRVEYHNAGDWRAPEMAEAPLPCVTTSREHGVLLRKRAGQRLKLEVVSRFYDAPTQNVVAHITGARWPQQQLVLGGHHDTVFAAAGGNDNASGTIAVMETARVLAALKKELGVEPGCALHFATFSAEEQRLAGAAEYARRHCGPESNTRLVLNLDELSTGHIKGVVLAFSHLRELVQGQLDDMGDGLKCHVMAQLDSSSDHYPFLRQGIDAAHLWRWRFHGRHADSNYHHESADTSDKLNVRELKEYTGQLARLLLRLSHVQPEQWPQNPQTVEKVQQRLEAERGVVVRVF